MNRFITLAMAVSALTLGGCASIVNGQNQPVSVDTRQGADAIVGANCTLSNDKGTWYVTSPGSATVHRSSADLAIKCEKNGSNPGLSTVKSFTKGMAFGNILFGGIIGAGVDISTGAAFDYPSLISVQMGQSLVMAPPAGMTSAADATAAVKTANANNTGATAGVEPAQASQPKP
jgi:predicted metal-binding protein